jgi:hypothetical protein
LQAAVETARLVFYFDLPRHEQYTEDDEDVNEDDNEHYGEDDDGAAAEE